LSGHHSPTDGAPAVAAGAPPSFAAACEPPLSRHLHPSAHERYLFWTATALVLLHVLVFSFIAVQPGASRLDHLPAATVSLVVAVLAMGFYPRLRPGVRAMCGLLFGVLALVGGGIAVADTLKGGPAGSDYTGFLLLPAGLGLCSLGAWLLWVSRKRDRLRWVRRALLAVGAFLAVYWLVLPLSTAMFATQRPTTTAQSADYGRPAEAVVVTTSDGLSLTGRYVPSQNQAAVIVYPGDWATAHGRLLAGSGYGVLMLDPRGYGKSEGDPNAFGWGNTRDIDAAVAFLEGRPDVGEGRIGGLGLSVGGEQMIEAAAENPGLAAVVSEGTGTRSVRETLARSDAGVGNMIMQLPYDAVLTAAVTVLSGHAPPPSLEKLSSQVSPRALFLIYGEKGQEAEKALAPTYFEAAREPKRIWEVPDAAHIGGLAAQPQEYRKRVIGFFNEYLLNDR